MKTLKDTLKESLLDDFGEQTKDLRRMQIEEWLDNNHNEDRETWPLEYKINKDYTIDIAYFIYVGKGNFPDYIQFNKCDVDFSCNDCNMTSLRGCPKYVGESFSCSSNNLKTLKYGPSKSQYYFCSNNHLKTLDFSPEKVIHFYCDNNHLKSLKGCPSIILDALNCENNKLTSLKDAPYNVKYIYCSGNPLSDEAIVWAKNHLNTKEIKY